MDSGIVVTLSSGRPLYHPHVFDHSIDLLIRVAAETGTMRILRGEGGVGGGSGPYSAWQEKSEIQAE